MSIYVFGFGSIINDASRLKTRRMDASVREDTIQQLNNEGRSGGFYDDAVAASISSDSYVRQWCFRSNTGFTALGLVPSSSSKSSEEVFGVLFPVTAEELRDFDHREQNYHRVALRSTELSILTSYGCEQAQTRARQLLTDPAFVTSTVWTYIPDKVALPGPEHPVLTTYLDVCLIGCLDWGGEELAVQFLRSTHCWPEYHLDDSLCSRRPWLHRRRYEEIDRCLKLCATHVRWTDRLHSEEYAARHLSVLRGTWGLPSRNPLFVGREDCLSSLHARLCAGIAGGDPVQSGTPALSSDSSYSGIAAAEIIGQAGIGKSSLAAEYCWRHWEQGMRQPMSAELLTQTATAADATNYGLILWLRAETIATLAEDMRQFASDMGIIKQASTAEERSFSLGGSSPSAASGLRANRSSGMLAGSGGARSNLSSSDLTATGAVGNTQGIEDSVVIQEVHRRLSQCKCRWLIVFDNVEDIGLLDSYIPRYQRQQHYASVQGSETEMDGSEVSEYGVDVTDDNGFHLSRSELYSAGVSGRNGKNNVSTSKATTWGGSILITTRCKLAPVLRQKLRLHCQYSLTLSCFTDRDSVLYLRSFLKERKLDTGIKTYDYYRPLAVRLGHLPLALSVAAAYMQQCEVGVEQYLRRLDALLTTETQDLLATQMGAEDGSSYVVGGSAEEVGVGTVSFKTIAYSLSMTLSRIKDQSRAAYQVLCCLSFLYTENISKHFLQQLLAALVVILRDRDLQDCRERKHEAHSTTIIENFEDNLNGPAPDPVCISAPSRDGQGVSLICMPTVSPDGVALSVGELCVHFLTVFLAVSAVLVATFLHSGLVDERLKQMDIFDELVFPLAMVAGGTAAVCSSGLLYIRTLLNVSRNCEISSSGGEPAPESASRTLKRSSNVAVTASTVGINPLYNNDATNLDVEIECDQIWLILKQFSILVTDDSTSDSSASGPLATCGSIHRLQQAVIRIICRAEDTLYCQVCVEALCAQWRYSLHDARTWAACAELLPHIEALCAHLVARGCGGSSNVVAAPSKNTDFTPSSDNSLGGGGVPPDAVLRLVGVLTDCACFAATSSSQFVVAQKLLQTAAALHLQASQHPAAQQARLTAAIMRTDILHTAGKVFRYQGELENAECALTLALQFKHRRLLSALATCAGEVDDGTLSASSLGTLQPALKVAQHLEGAVRRVESLMGDSAPGVASLSPLLCSISNTLHELGVLNSRLRRGDASKVMFGVALPLKSLCHEYYSQLGVRTDADADADAALSIDALGEASTYHQLGVAAINDRNYEEAERYLYKALQLEFHHCTDSPPKPGIFNNTGGGSEGEVSCFAEIIGMISAGKAGSLKLNMVAKAATLQQFGRLLLRRGQLRGSLQLLKHSLQMFEYVYGASSSGSGGKDVAHVNLAAIRHQLGAVTLALGELEEAEEHVSRALGIRETIFQYEFSNKYGLVGASVGGSSDDDSDNPAAMAEPGNVDEAGGAGLFYSTINAQLEILQELQLLAQVYLARHGKTGTETVAMRSQHIDATVVLLNRQRSTARKLLLQFDLHRDESSELSSAARGDGTSLQSLLSGLLSTEDCTLLTALPDDSSGGNVSYGSKQQAWIEESLYKYWQDAVEQLVLLYTSMNDETSGNNYEVRANELEVRTDLSPSAMPLSPSKWRRLVPCLSQAQRSDLARRHSEFYITECSHIKQQLKRVRQRRGGKVVPSTGGNTIVGAPGAPKTDFNTNSSDISSMTMALARLLRRRVLLLYMVRECLRSFAGFLQHEMKALGKAKGMQIGYGYDSLLVSCSQFFEYMTISLRTGMGVSETGESLVSESLLRGYTEEIDRLPVCLYVAFIQSIEDKAHTVSNMCCAFDTDAGVWEPGAVEIASVLELVASAVDISVPGLESSDANYSRIISNIYGNLLHVFNTLQNLAEWTKGTEAVGSTSEAVAKSSVKAVIISIYQLTDYIRLHCCEVS